MRVRILFISILIFVCSCSYFQEHNLFYKTYHHPSLQFSIQYPRQWEMKEGGNMGSQVVFLSNDTYDVFRPNANIMAVKADITDLSALMKLSEKQLKLILNQYEVITKNPTKLGTVDAFELRGTYVAKEGNRLIRTIVAIQGNLEYVFTFTCAIEMEKNYTKIINHMIQSFSL